MYLMRVLTAYFYRLRLPASDSLASYTLIVSILGVVAKRLSQSLGIFVYTPVAQSVCAYPKNETLWVYWQSNAKIYAPVMSH
jgi:hypothetical protein